MALFNISRKHPQHHAGDCCSPATVAPTAGLSKQDVALLHNPAQAARCDKDILRNSQETNTGAAKAREGLFTPPKIRPKEPPVHSRHGGAPYPNLSRIQGRLTLADGFWCWLSGCGTSSPSAKRGLWLWIFQSVADWRRDINLTPELLRHWPLTVAYAELIIRRAGRTQFPTAMRKIPELS